MLPSQLCCLLLLDCKPCCLYRVCPGSHLAVKASLWAIVAEKIHIHALAIGSAAILLGQLAPDLSLLISSKLCQLLTKMDFFLLGMWLRLGRKKQNSGNVM